MYTCVYARVCTRHSDTRRLRVNERVSERDFTRAANLQKSPKLRKLNSNLTTDADVTDENKLSLINQSNLSMTNQNFNFRRSWTLQETKRSSHRVRSFRRRVIN